MRKLLFNRQSPYIQPIRGRIMDLDHKTIAMWALACAPRVLALFEERVPGEVRPREAIETAKLWMRGQVKMPEAKKAIHAAHNAAAENEKDPAACAAARAAGHAAATVHVETHGLGLVFYGLTALVYAAGEDAVEQECQWYLERLEYWAEAIKEDEGPWAPFLVKEKPNKEKLLWEKERLAK